MYSCTPSIHSVESTRKKKLDAVPSVQSSRTFVRPQPRDVMWSTQRTNNVDHYIMLTGIASAEVCFKCRLLETSFVKIYVFY